MQDQYIDTILPPNEYFHETLDDIRIKDPELLEKIPEWVINPESQLNLDPWMLRFEGNTYDMTYLFIGNSGLRFNYLDRNKAFPGTRTRWVQHFTPDGYQYDTNTWQMMNIEPTYPNPVKYAQIYGVSFSTMLDYWKNDWNVYDISKPTLVYGSTNKEMYRFRDRLFNNFAPGSFLLEPKPSTNLNQDTLSYSINMQALSISNSNESSLSKISQKRNQIMRKYSMRNHHILRIIDAHLD